MDRRLTLRTMFLPVLTLYLRDGTRRKSRTRKSKTQRQELGTELHSPSHHLEGRCVWGRFNLKNPNPQAEQIGQAQFMDMARAIGLEVVDDSDQILGGELDIKVTVKKGDELYNDSNDVKGFKALQGMTVITQKPFQKPAPQPVGAGAPAKAATPPWAKK